MSEYTVGDVVTALGYNPGAVVKLLNDAGAGLSEVDAPDLAAEVSRDVVVRLWVLRAGQREARKLGALLRL